MRRFVIDMTDNQVEDLHESAGEICEDLSYPRPETVADSVQAMLPFDVEGVREVFMMSSGKGGEG